MPINKLNFPRESLAHKEKFFVFWAMLSIFFISVEYAVIRPASISIFITAYSAKFLPYAWIGTAVLSIFVIFLYNRFLPRLGCLKTFFLIVLCTILSNTIAAFCVTDFLFFPFLIYIWKDIYVLLMFKQIWSLVHMTVSKEKAKYLYGIICATGGIGAILGGIIPGFFAINIGSQRLFLFSLPFYLALAFCYIFTLKYASNQDAYKKQITQQEKFSKGGLTLIKNSRFLLCIFLLVAFMQMAMALTEYQLNFFIEKTIPEMNLRTQYIGRLVSIMNAGSTFFQLIGTYFFISFLGIKKIYFSIPFYLMTNALILMFFPSFFIVSYAYVAIKAADYSIFNITKEMLFIPLKVDEKFRAKAIIDVVSYRSAKGLMSFFVLFFQFFHLDSSIFLGIFSLSIFVSWIYVIKNLSRQPQFSFMQTSSLPILSKEEVS